MVAIAQHLLIISDACKGARVKRKKILAITGLIGTTIPIVALLGRSSFQGFWLEQDYLTAIYPILLRLLCPIVIPVVPLLGDNTEDRPKFFIVLAVAGLLNGCLYGALGLIASLRGRAEGNLFPILIIVCVVGYWVWITLQNWHILFQ